MSPPGAEALTSVAARAVLATHARSFRFAGAFLPSARLDDAAVVYAFCRAVDDAVDDAPSLAAAQKEAAALARELRGEAAPRPEVRSFLETARRIGIESRFADELVAGVTFDAQEIVAIADDEQLLRYCYLVAGTVGGMMCAVLGVRDARALPFAIDLGIAMQLTNICRDVLEDAQRGRAYLPATRLGAAGIEPATFTARVQDDSIDKTAVADVVRQLLLLADDFYCRADLGMGFIPLRSRVAILVASRVYRAIGRKLLRRGANSLGGRTVVSFAEKLLWAVGGALGVLSPRYWNDQRASRRSTRKGRGASVVRSISPTTSTLEPLTPRPLR